MVRRLRIGELGGEGVELRLADLFGELWIGGGASDDPILMAAIVTVWMSDAE